MELASTTSVIHQRSGKSSQKSFSSQENNEKEKICNDLKNSVLFDSVGIEFHVAVFFHQFFCHMILPLFFSLPNPYGQGLQPNFSSIYMTFITPILFYVMIIAFFIASDDDQKTLGYSMWIPFLSFCTHRLIISLKYATLSPTEYKRFCECENKELSSSYQKQMMLVSGWLELHPLVLFFEVGAASLRVGESVSKVFILLKPAHHSEAARSQIKYWNAFLRGHEYIDIDSPPAPEMVKLQSGDYAISVYDICTTLLKRTNSNRQFENFAYITANIFVAIIIILSFIPFMNLQNEFDQPAAVAVYMITSTLFNFTYGKVFYVFMALILYDVIRLKCAIKGIHYMIRLADISMEASLSVKGQVTEITSQFAEQRRTAIAEMNRRAIWTGSYSLPNVEEEISIVPENVNDGLRERQITVEQTKTISRESAIFAEKRAENGSMAWVPRITFEYPENFLAWAILRVTVQNFGLRFRFRTDIYVIFIAIVIIGIMILSITEITIANDKLEVFQSVYTIQAIYCVAVLVIFLIFISFVGAEVNNELIAHNRTLSAHLIKVKAKLHYSGSIYSTSDGMENGQFSSNQTLLEKQAEVLSDVIDILEVNNELRPFKFFGLTAQNGLTMSILTTAISFYTVLLSLYFGTDSVFAKETSYGS
jgi:hypothetical protein